MKILVHYDFAKELIEIKLSGDTPQIIFQNILWNVVSINEKDRDELGQLYELELEQAPEEE